jgi:3-carboxy-cis,cis-muconate cycloisomerase
VLHRGLTSQDVLDTALMLMASDVIDRIMGDLRWVTRQLGELADRHRGSVMPGRTLGQYAVPITFGLKASQWLAGVLDALDRLDRIYLPAQCGGAAGDSGSLVRP